MDVDDRLVEITGAGHQVDIDLVYAGAGNLTGRPIYANACCLLHRDAEPRLRHAGELAALCGLRLKVLDAYRPPQAQERLWQSFPDPVYVADAAQGSNHTRGVAVDVTLAEAGGADLDMGTPFDSMELRAHHQAPGLSPQIQRNRFALVGIMAMAGFLAIDSEWWHYELPGARGFPLLQDGRVRCAEKAGNPPPAAAQGG